MRANMNEAAGRTGDTVDLWQFVRSLDDALADFDTSQIRKRIDRSLNSIAGRAVDGVTNELLNFYGTPTTQPEPAESADISPNVPELTLANAVRLSRKNANIDKALTLIETGQHSLADLATEIGVHPKTIGRYIEDLRTGGHNISVNGVVKLT